VLSGVQDQRSVMRTLQLGAAGFVPKSMATTTGLGDKFVMSGGFYIPRTCWTKPSGLVRCPARAARSKRDMGSGRVDLN